MLYPLWMCRRVTVLWLCVLCLIASGPACAQVDRLNALITSGQTDKPALDQLLTSLSEEQREQCVAALVTHLESSDWRHREAAAYVAGQLGPKAGPIARQLIKAMACDMSNVAWEVAPALGKIGAAAVPAVIDELKACQALPDKVG
ncbi:MAG TPA: hypothetical protein PKO06_08580, partial [Candidatus Ozemobacteraceae bacterium]|nr:hypothetical protein [Candidatus Ozemobacteraceae bacterium]